MDKLNRFHPPSHYNLMRLDYFVVISAMSLLVLFNFSDVNWVRFWVAFWWIDVVGTLPAYYVYFLRRKGEHRSISPMFYHVYNFAHSLTTNTIVVGIWYAVTGSFEWAMLAIPIHILGDRSVFGNMYKHPRMSFEPVMLKAYASFQEKFDTLDEW